MTQITLLPSQVSHVDKLTHILTFNPFALDLSSLGSGKTYTSCFIAQREPEKYKNIIVIAPVSVKVKWIQMQKDYNIPLTNAISYCELRSIKCKQPKHGLLHRRDYTVQQQNPRGAGMINVDKCDFTVSDKFKKMVEEGVLIVIDEIQNVKNVNSQFHACQALIKHIVSHFTPESKSRVILLSGSPIDKTEQAIHMFRSLHIMKHERLSHYDFREHAVVWDGMQDIVDYANSVNSMAMQKLIEEWGGLRRLMRIRDTYMTRFCYNIFQDVIKPVISSAMLPPEHTFTINKCNGFYHIVDDTEAQLLIDAVYNLGKATRFENNRINGTLGLQSLRSISAAMLQIETAKIGTFVRITCDALLNNPNQKVALCVNYTSTIQDLVKYLDMFDPLVLDGTVSVQKRAHVLRLFQASNTNHRLIIGNIHVMSTGIDLDDKNGRFPRVAFVSPNYNTINLYQLGFRFLRADTKSASTIHYIYGAHAREHKILSVLASKSRVMKETTPEQAAHGVVFPNDHESFHETPPEDFTQRQVFDISTTRARRLYLQEIRIRERDAILNASDTESDESTIDADESAVDETEEADESAVDETSEDEL